MLTTIEDIFVKAKEKSSISSPKKLVLCQAANAHALEAVMLAAREGIITPILTGDKSKIEETARGIGFDLTGVEILEASTPEEAVEIGVRAVHDKYGDVLMKGGITTPQIMKGVLNKEYGLRTGSMISHLAIFDIPAYHKLLTLTDAAMNIAPSLEEKAVIVQNTVNFLRKVGFEDLKVAAIAAIEQVNPKMPATIEADALKQMNARGEITGCTLDGPMSFDLAISMESKEEKGFDSPVSGDADVILAPDIEGGNFLYKCFGYFAGARGGAVILGAAAPIVLTSRADTMDTKLASIALAVAGA